MLTRSAVSGRAITSEAGFRIRLLNKIQNGALLEIFDERGVTDRQRKKF
jgi:hypothetical protein